MLCSDELGDDLEMPRSGAIHERPGIEDLRGRCYEARFVARDPVPDPSE